MNRTVLATPTFFDEAAIAFLQAHNCEVVLSGMSPGTPDTSLSRERIFELLRNANAWIVATAPVSREMLETFPNLRGIAKRGVGVDQIEWVAAKEVARVVSYAPGG